MSERASTKRIWCIAEIFLWLLGAALVLFVLHGRMSAASAQEAALVAFRTQPAAANQALWSESRKRRYQKARTENAEHAPAGVLSIPSIRLEVAVFEGTSAQVLNLGVGRVSGTAPIGGEGNVALAGHRDGFFRGLKDIADGDAIVVETSKGARRYTVEETMIVDPEDVYVLEQRNRSELTLITCYPFYFIGSAPRRFIVRAALDD